MKILLAFALIITTSLVFGQTTKPIIVQNQYYPKPGKENEVYQCRLHGSDVRARLGLPKGKVLRKMNETGREIVVWECEYPSLEERKKDVASLEQSEEFRRVQEHMSTLVEKFERKILEQSFN